VPRKTNSNKVLKQFLKRQLNSSVDGALGVSGLHFLAALRLKCNIAYDEKSFLACCKGIGSDRLTTSLDIGCGAIPRNPFGAEIAMGVDIQESKNEEVVSADLLLTGIPFEDRKFDFVIAYDFLEHVPRVSVSNGTCFPFVNLMSEIYRVLRVGGLFYSHTPAYPFPEAFIDPKHVNYVTEETFPRYFYSSSSEGPVVPEAFRYGFTGCFELLEQQWLDFRLLTVMRKISSEA
jgi:SAM-dependent methyltransferase